MFFILFLFDLILCVFIQFYWMSEHVSMLTTLANYETLQATTALYVLHG